MRFHVRPRRTGTSARRRPLLLPLALVLASTGAITAATPAAAGDHSAKIHVWTKHTDQGYIVAVARVPATAEKIREFISDGERAHNLAPTTIKATKTADDGTCQRMHLKVRGVFSPFEIDTRRCRTAKGFRETMVASDDFDFYDVEWVIEPAGEYSMVSFRARNVLSMAVPQGLQIRESKKVMAKTVKNLASALR